ncbi:unnamed protein product [Blepharisma stoltei]|uniref:Cyclic nucleotide-binding domain-containing protein n=1 Tax=Blepharisma stoltei TaxID=1481888 RepID=A0AAU9J4R2_9CILI|nr:unnamed protein product [Blepharisma stoltei]
MNKSTRAISKNTRKIWASTSIAQSVLKRAVTSTFATQNMTASTLRSSYFPDPHARHRWHLNFGVFKPDSNWKLLWDICGISQILYLAFILPFALSYGNVRHFNFIIKFIEAFFYFDILVNMNTGFYFSGSFITDHKSIWNRYLKSWFPLDLISSIPLEDIMPYMDLGDDTRGNPFEFHALYFVKTLWLLRLLRFVKIKKVLYQIMDEFPHPILIALVRILTFFGIAFFATHWMSCIIYASHRLAFQTIPEIWIKYDIPRSDKWLFYFFYVFETMATVGYISIVTDPREKILILLIMYMSGLIYGYLIEGIREAISKSQQQQSYFRSAVLRMKFYMTNNKIPSSLRSRVFLFIEHLERIADENILDETEILQSLSLPLKEEILIKTRGYFLFNSAPFRNYSHYFLRYLVHFLEIQVFGPGDLIIKEGEIGKNIYWIFNGSVEIYDQKTFSTFRDLFKGKYFGEIGFFLNKKRCASAKAKTYTELFELKRYKFNQLTSTRHSEEETTNLLAKQCERDLSALGVRCYFCSEIGHAARDCKKYVFIVDHKKVIKKADHRKYQISKIVSRDKIAEKNKMYRKKISQVEQFRRYDTKNLPGREEHLANFQDRSSLVAKARLYQMNSSRYSNASSLALIEEELGEVSHDSEMPNELLPESFQFGKNFVRKHMISRSENMEPSIGGSIVFSSEIPSTEYNLTLNDDVFDCQINNNAWS